MRVLTEIVEPDARFLRSIVLFKKLTAIHSDRKSPQIEGWIFKILLCDEDHFVQNNIFGSRFLTPNSIRKKTNTGPPWPENTPSFYIVSKGSQKSIFKLIGSNN